MTARPHRRYGRAVAKRDEARRGETRRRVGTGRDGTNGTGTAHGTGRNGSGRLRDERRTRGATRPDAKGARSRWGSAETKPRDGSHASEGAGCVDSYSENTDDHVHRIDVRLTVANANLRDSGSYNFHSSRLAESWKND